MGNAYVINLAQFGIVGGLPAKPYVTADYLQADANVTGFTNAIRYAADEGYSEVVVPKGKYAVCYPNYIKVNSSHLTVNLNGAVFKEIYDSTTQSPFDLTDRSITQDPWRFPWNAGYGSYYCVFRVEDCEHTEILGGELIGDLADRTFENPASETENEWTNGIQVAKSASFIRTAKNKVSYFMGDGVSFENSAIGEFAEFGLGLTVGDINRADGEPMASTVNMYSQFMPIPAPASNLHVNAWMVTGEGYSRTTYVNAQEVGIAYYDAEDHYIRTFEKQRVFNPITIPLGATKYRFIIYNETTTTKDYRMHLKFGLTPHNCTVEENEIFGCHRGGMTPGGNNLIVQNNIIHECGLNLLDGKPLFDDPTRYGINQEDSFGIGTVIRDNIIYNCHHGILIGAYCELLENNHINDCTGVGINLYLLKKGTIRDNYIRNCATSLGLMTAGFGNAHVTIDNNTLIGGNLLLNAGNGYHIDMQNNHIEDVVNFAYPDDNAAKFSNNHFHWTANFVGTPVITINRMEDCTMSTAGVRKLITLKAYEIRNLIAKNMLIRVSTRNQGTKREDMHFEGGRFESSQLENWLFSMKQRAVTFNKTAFVDTTLYIGNTNTVTENPAYKLTDCDITTNVIQWLVESVFNNASQGFVTIEDSRIEINNAQFPFLYLVKLSPYTLPTLTFALKRSVVTFVGAAKLALAFYSNKNIVRAFISAGNEFKNITLPVRDSIFIGYDPDEAREAEPVYGTFFVGQTVKNARPDLGDPTGWVCLSTGVAGDEPRTACGTSWAGSASKRLGDQVRVFGRVYTCTGVTSSGTGLTGTVAPVFPTSTGATVVDGTVTWTDSGLLASFAPLPVL